MPHPTIARLLLKNLSLLSPRPVTKTCLEPIVVMVQSYRAPFARLSDPSRLSNQLEYCSPPPPKIGLS